MTLTSTGEDAYFAASNSAKGFFSYYAECFDDARIQRVFAIKGGPGTGKSYFMRSVAAYAQAQQWECEFIYCSSDPRSLDGIILSRGDSCIALLDATAPHVYEPRMPGVREEIVDLGAFWDAERLAEHAKEIEAWNQKKQSAYKSAYRYLSAYGTMMENRDALVAPYIRLDDMETYAEKLFWEIPCGKSFSFRHALMRSVGMDGLVGFDTYFAQARRIFLVEDCRGSAQYFMRMLYHLAERKRLRVRVSHDPILPERIDGLFLCECGYAFAVGKTTECPYSYKRIGTRRFVDVSSMKAIKAPINHAEQMCRAMLGGTVEAMKRVREAHFHLETLYISSMDFAAKEEFTKDFCQKLFPLQSGENCDTI